MKITRPPSEATEDQIDIDITPVMNMFVVLIPFLVTLAVFSQLAMIEFSLPPNVSGGLEQSGGSPKLKITVVAAEEFLGVTYGENMLDSIPKVNGDYNYEALYKSLVSQKQKFEINNEMVVAVRDPVKVKFVVTVMDWCRKAGFEKIGLSSATDNPENL